MFGKWKKSPTINTLDRWISKGVCCAILLGIIAIILGACALDQGSIERKRAEIEFLCAEPKTVVLKELCDRVAPNASGPVDLLKTP